MSDFLFLNFETSFPCVQKSALLSIDPQIGLGVNSIPRFL